MDRSYHALPKLIALASILAGCGVSQTTASVPAISAGAATRAQTFSAQPETIRLIVRPKMLFISGPSSQGFIMVQYNGLGTLTAVSSRSHGMPVHPQHPGRRPKVYVITQHCFCQATITVRDNLGHHDSMTVQGT